MCKNVQGKNLFWCPEPRLDIFGWTFFFALIVVDVTSIFSSEILRVTKTTTLGLECPIQLRFCASCKLTFPMGPGRSLGRSSKKSLEALIISFLQWPTSIRQIYCSFVNIYMTKATKVCFAFQKKSLGIL